jgi:Ca2+-binding RTX toxin-like protein
MPTLTGNWWDDTIHADPGNNNEIDEEFLIYGYQGNDDLFGAGNDDFIDGGTGADFMFGDKGDDTYVVDNVGDVVRELDPRFTAFGGDHDLIYTSISLTLPEFVEDLSLLTGAGAINGTGNELENIIHGNESGNTLQGLDGEDLIIGHDGDDTLRGGNHNDELHGNNHNDTLEGGDGEDDLFGGAQADTLRGGAHNDTLDGGTGADTMEGGGGSDVYYVDHSDDAITELSNQGTDSVFSTAAAYTLSLSVENLTLGVNAGAIDGTGSLDANTIVGNGSDNELRGEAGNDTLRGNGGADVLRGGLHNDVLEGGGGDDELRGDGGDDEMRGGANNDEYWVDSIGDDVIEATGQGIDTVNAGGALESYQLTPNVENLTLLNVRDGTGNGQANTIIGNIMDNTLDGAGGADTMEGRLGDDTYIVDTANDVVVETGDQGNDTVQASVTYTLGAGVSVETLETTNATGTGTIHLTGNERVNTIVGNDGRNALDGRGGSDVLDGRGGVEDTAVYSSNPNFVVVVLGQNGAAGYAQEFGPGPNGALTLLSMDTLLNIEYVHGSNFGDTIVGNQAVNELRGRGGSDIYVVQNAGSRIIEFSQEGSDEVRTTVDYTLTAGAEVERLRTTQDTGTAPINLTGNEFGNEITGNDGDNTIDGGFGVGTSDALIGRDGSDTYIVRNANDTITENGGQGIDTVQAAVSYELTAGADVEFLRTTDDAGTAALNLTGNANGNEVIGNNGNNTINGGGGRDDLTGNGGRDAFLFDTPLVSTELNVGRILDFTRGTDLIHLEDSVFAAFATGPLADDRFVAGTVALDGNDNILYDQASGALFYDADGSGKGAPIQFAEVTRDLDLSNTDFLII